MPKPSMSLTDWYETDTVGEHSIYYHTLPPKPPRSRTSLTDRERRSAWAIAPWLSPSLCNDCGEQLAARWGLCEDCDVAD